MRYLDITPARKTMAYYVEYTGDDVKLPKGIAKKVYGCMPVHTAAYTDLKQNFVTWGKVKRNGKDVEILYVDGKNVRENPYLVEQISSTASSSKKSSTSGTSSSSSTSSSTSVEE